MKKILVTLVLIMSTIAWAQDTNDKMQIEATLNLYIDGFYQGDTLKLKQALKPRLYKFGYLKDKETEEYKYYQHLPYDAALKLAQRLKDQGKLRTETKIRSVEVLEIANHIASARLTGTWGLDYVLLSKDNGKWMIEQVLWEGPYLTEYAKTNTTTTYYLIRHAEKDRSDPNNKNPHLTEAGLKRAQNWTSFFKHIDIDLVYSTDYYRTKETALPTAKSKGLEINLYDPRNLNSQEFLTRTKGKKVLIVGHSNSTPHFANRLLGEKKYQTMDEANNANVYMITLDKQNATSQLFFVD